MIGAESNIGHIVLWGLPDNLLGHPIVYGPQPAVC